MKFPHRPNCDGTIDSICDRCFVTIGTSIVESDLERLEAAHVCEPARVDYYKIDSVSKRPPQGDRHNQPVNAAERIIDRR